MNVGNGSILNLGVVYATSIYAIKAFRWSSVQLGYWLSFVGFWRALYLSTILPIFLKGFYAREERLSDSADEGAGQKDPSSSRPIIALDQFSRLHAY